LNIKAVAEKAGVSITTVSRVLNRPEMVSEKTKENVLAVMKQMDYTPNWFARNILSKKTNVIGLLIPDVRNPANLEIAKGVEDAAHQKGYNVMFCNTEYQKEKELQYIDTLLERKVDGLILTSSQLSIAQVEAIRKKDSECVLIGKTIDDVQADMIFVDYISVTQEAIEHLLRMGRKNIGILLSEHPKVEEREKLEGYKCALAGAGVSFCREMVSVGEQTMEGGYVAMGKLLQGSCLPDAVFASTDQMALGVMEKLKQMGISVPNDIAVIGCDDLEFGAVMEPGLTTITRPMYRMGLMAARLLFDNLEEEQPQREGQKIILKAKLKIRKSCGNKERIREIW
jgi:LacI family transcriptional regulator